MKGIVVCLLFAVSVAACGGNEGGGVSNSSPAPSISGAVTSSYAGMEGVTMTLSGSSSATVATDAKGNFIFSGVNSGSYTLTPGKPGYTFSPAYKTLIKNVPYLAGENFVGSPAGINGSPPAYFPMKVGNKWVWQASDPATGPATWLETSEIISYDGTLYSMQVTNASKSVEYLAPVNNAWAVQKIVYYGPFAAPYVNPTENAFSPSKLVFPSNTTSGTHESQTTTDTFTDITAFSSYQTHYTVDIVVDALETVTVPAGTFNNALRCLYTTTNLDLNSSSTTTVWFAAGVGEVRSTSPELTRELSSFAYY